MLYTNHNLYGDSCHLVAVNEYSEVREQIFRDIKSKKYILPDSVWNVYDDIMTNQEYILSHYEFVNLTMEYKVDVYQALRLRMVMNDAKELLKKYTIQVPKNKNIQL